MPKIRSVVVWTAAAAVTLAMEVVGLDRAIGLRDQLTNAPGGPPPVPVAASSAAESPPLPAPPLPIRLLTVRDDAVVIEAGGQRRELAGYPPPRLPNHRHSRLTTALVAPDGDLVAIAGECFNEYGAADPHPPSCAPVFVRLYRVADGGHVRDLRMRWRHADNDLRRPLAMAFDARAERLAVLVQTSWSDCMWAGDDFELLVYRLADGARVAHRIIRTALTESARDVTFHEDELHVVTARGNSRPRIRVVRLSRSDGT